MSLLNFCGYNVALAAASMDHDPIREWILSEGKATQITGIRSIGGGCINRASRYNTDAGSFFVKTNRYTGFLDLENIISLMKARNPFLIM